LNRILFLTESFYPVLGGGEQHIRELGRRLVDAGCEVTVVTRQGAPDWPDIEVLDGIRVRRVAPQGAGRKGKYLMLLPAMWGLVKERSRYDVLVVRGTRVLGLPGVLMARLLRKSIVLQAEVNGEFSGEIYTWGTRAARGIVDRMLRVLTRFRNLWLLDADAFVAMSHQIQGECLAAGVPRHKLERIPHGVDTQRFRPADTHERRALRERLGLPIAGELIVYAGRLLRGKGLDNLLEAFAAVRPEFPTAGVVFVGSGDGQSLSIEAELRAQAAGFHGAVIFTGRVDDVASHLRAADIAVLPSVFEALGLGVVEAAACGVPAIGSRTGGIVDVIVDGETGLLSEPGGAASLAAALRLLLADPALRARLGARARERALARFDVRDSVDRYRCLFGELVA
jgi:glycosyltransferase involved in cell wall biosynthesis